MSIIITNIETRKNTIHFLFPEVEIGVADGVDGVNGSKSIALGSIAGVVAGGYGLYVLVGSASATIIFWLLPYMAGEHVLHTQATFVCYMQ